MKKTVFIILCLLIPFSSHVFAQCNSPYTFQQVDPMGEINTTVNSFCQGQMFRLISSPGPGPNNLAASAIWCNNNTLDLNLPFTADFSIRFSNNNAGADGITFTMHRAPNGLNSLGQGGGFMGYAGNNLITPSVSVEFDIFNNNPFNNGNLGDIPNDHSTINFNGNLNNPMTTPVDLGNIEDGAWHTVQVIWDPCDTTLCVTIDGNINYCLQNDLINNVFNGNGANVIWGFTAGEGNNTSNQDVCFCNLTVGEPCASYCCDGDNLLTNGSFELGGLGFSSDYTVSRSMTPKHYGVIDYTAATRRCVNWDVEDHTHCLTGENQNVLFVNGATQQASNVNNVIWQSGTINIDPGSEYRFCAYMQNLPQCCFDIYPVVTVQFNQGNGWRNLVINETIDINTSQATANPCNWQEVGGTFIANNNNVALRILLDEQGNGDGNDLALDDISLMESTPINPVQISVQTQIMGGNMQVTGSLNQLTPADDILPADCDHTWTIRRVNTIFPLTFIGPPVTGGSTGNFNWGLTTTFPGYNFVTGGSGYRITLDVDCGCLGNGSASRFTNALSFPSRLAPSDGDDSTGDEGKPTNHQLYQNRPNPFNHTTEISYFLAEEDVDAQIVILNPVTGATLKTYPLTGRGQGKIVLDASDLADGVYIYSLIVNGKKVQTKSMVLTK